MDHSSLTGKYSHTVTFGQDAKRRVSFARNAHVRYVRPTAGGAVADSQDVRRQSGRGIPAGVHVGNEVCSQTLSVRTGHHATASRLGRACQAGVDPICHDCSSRGAVCGRG